MAWESQVQFCSKWVMFAFALFLSLIVLPLFLQQIFHAREREAHGGQMPPKSGGPSDREPLSKPKQQPEVCLLPPPFVSLFNLSSFWMLQPQRRRGGLSSHTLMEFKKAFDKATREELDRVHAMLFW